MTTPPRLPSVEALIEGLERRVRELEKQRIPDDAPVAVDLAYASAARAAFQIVDFDEGGFITVPWAEDATDEGGWINGWAGSNTGPEDPDPPGVFHTNAPNIFALSSSGSPGEGLGAQGNSILSSEPGIFHASLLITWEGELDPDTSYPKLSIVWNPPRATSPETFIGSPWPAHPGAAIHYSDAGRPEIPALHGKLPPTLQDMAVSINEGDIPSSAPGFPGFWQLRLGQASGVTKGVHVARMLVVRLWPPIYTSASERFAPGWSTDLIHS